MDDFDHQPEGVKYANNFDIWKNINAMLHGSLSIPDMGPTAAPPDQSKRKVTAEIYHTLPYKNYGELQNLITLTNGILGG